VCTFDPARISLADGKIPDDAKLVAADVVRYTKQLSTSAIRGVPIALHGQEADTLARDKERTVFVIHAEALDSFLSSFHVDQFR
jgi:hypothetical protein